MSIPDEKARVWTRPEDYWPPRRPARLRRTGRLLGRQNGDQGQLQKEPRLLLTTIPYVVLMVCLAVLTVAIMFVAWPGNRQTAEPAKPAAAEVGTAPKGWLVER